MSSVIVYIAALVLGALVMQFLHAFQYGRSFVHDVILIVSVLWHRLFLIAPIVFAGLATYGLLGGQTILALIAGTLSLGGLALLTVSQFLKTRGGK
jgi:hypothetical protein